MVGIVPEALADRRAIEPHQHRNSLLLGKATSKKSKIRSIEINMKKTRKRR